MFSPKPFSFHLTLLRRVCAPWPKMPSALTSAQKEDSSTNGRWPRSSPHGKNPGCNQRLKLKLTLWPEHTGNQVSYLPSEWVKILKAFRDKYGQRIPEYYLPAQCYFETFEEKVNEGRIRAETLAQVISLEEEEAQERSKPEHPKQLHLTLEANLTLQTRRRFISQMPVSVEQLRTKYQVLSNMWLLAKLRQPGRALYRDLDERTWPLLLEELLNRKNFAFQRQLENSEVMVGPDWNHCLEYEYQIRKEALRRTEEDGMAIGAALWATYNCPQHRMEHWITFLTVANARSEKERQTKNTALENKVSSLEKQLANLRNNRSRSPRKQLAITNKPQSENSTTVAKVEVVERVQAKAKPKMTAREKHQLQQHRKGSKHLNLSKKSTVSTYSMRKLVRIQVSVFASRSTLASILENAAESTSALAVAKLECLTTIAAAWNQ